MPTQVLDTNLCRLKHVNLHQIGAVYGARVQYMQAHDGQQPLASMVSPQFGGGCNCYFKYLQCR